MSRLEVGSLLALGALHGLNPAMGWLFAVLRGLQESSRRVLVASLVPLGAGHLAAVGATLALVEGAGLVVPAAWVKIGSAAVLVAFGLWKLLSVRAHPRWVGLRLGAAELAAWSFLVSAVHGAGLMLLPLAAGGHGHAAGGLAWAAGAALVHTLAVVAVAGVAAIAVYDIVGVGILRRAWIDLDRVWALALLAAAVIVLTA